MDFLELQLGLGTIYDASDQADWEANYGRVAGLPLSAAASVPEPASVLLVLAGWAALSSRITRPSI